MYTIFYTYIYIYILSQSSSPHCLPFYDWGTCCFPFINLWFAPTWHRPGTRTPILHRHLRIFAGPSMKPGDFVCFWLQGLPWISWGKKRNIHGFNIKLWSYQRADLVRTYGFITIDSNHGQKIRLVFFLAITKKTKTPQLMSRKSNAWSKQEVERCLICLCQLWRSISQSGLNGTNVTSHRLLPQFGTEKKKHGFVTIG